MVGFKKETSKPLVVTSKFFPEYCGPGVRITNLYEHLNIDAKPEVITGSTDYESPEKYVHKGFLVSRVSFKLWKKIKQPILREVLRLLFSSWETVYTFFTLVSRYQSTKVVHILGSSSVTHAALLWSVMFNKKVVIELVNRNSNPYQKLFGFFKLFPKKQNTIIITISNELKSKCEALGYNSIIWNRPNPVNLTRFAGLRGNASNSNKVRLLNIGSFIPRKNQMLLLEAMMHLPNYYELEISGPITNKDKSENYYQKLISFILDNNLSGRVKVNTEFVDSLERMNECNLYLLPSFGEGLGTTLLEAIASNLPVVANKNEPAFVDWIEDSKNGYLSEPSGVAFAEAIMKAQTIDVKQLKQHNKKLTDKFCSISIHKKYNIIFNMLDNGCTPVTVLKQI